MQQEGWGLPGQGKLISNAAGVNHNFPTFLRRGVAAKSSLQIAQLFALLPPQPQMLGLPHYL